MVLLKLLRRFLPVHDISTDYQNPPQFLKGRQATPQLVSLLKVFYSDVKPVIVNTIDTAAVYAAALEAANAMPRWELLEEDQGSSSSSSGDSNSSRSFQAVSTTKVMRFKDDIVVRVTLVNGKVVVDTRSRSRIGQGDMGANGSRILQYQQKLSSLLAQRQLSRL